MRVLFVLLFCFISWGATADWQYTKWGMSADEVLAASKGKLKNCTPAACKGKNTDSATPRHIGRYQSGEFQFTVVTLFNNKSGKLVTVSLELNDPTQWASLVGALRGRYGEPASSSKTQIMSLWVWREKNDQISVIAIGQDHVTLSYSPRLTDSNKGL
jgi:hypothetical protein